MKAGFPGAWVRLSRVPHGQLFIHTEMTSAGVLLLARVALARLMSADEALKDGLEQR